MSQALQEQISEYLREGKPEIALQAALQLSHSEGATKEAAIHIARAAAVVYRELIVPPVLEFASAAPDFLPEDMGEVAQKALNRLFRMTEQWEERLRDVHRERLAREMREWLRIGETQKAAECVRQLMAMVEPDQLSRRASYIGGTVATVLNHQREARHLLKYLAKAPERYSLTEGLIARVEEARDKRTGTLLGANLANLEREYISSLTDAIVEIQRSLPEKSKMEEPDEKTLREVGDIFRSILRVPIWREEPELLLDATLLMVDFVPKENSKTSQDAGVEGRAYNQLGTTAKKAVLQTFLALGKIPLLPPVYKAWAERYLRSPYIGPIVEVMGALRSPEFHDFLSRVSKDPSMREVAATQLSMARASIADVESAEMLMEELNTLLKRRRFESAEMRESKRIVESLSKLIRSPRSHPDEAFRVMDFLRNHIPEDMTRLAMFAACKVFSYKPKAQNSDHRRWAIRVLVRGIWLHDDATPLHEGQGGPLGHLGFRAELVEALERIGPYDVYTVARSMEPLAAVYGAAYLAAAEACERLKDPELLPVLERMLNTAIHHDEESANKYLVEYIWDPGENKRVPLSKGRVIAALVHAIGTIGGEDAKAVLKRYQQQIASGRAAAPTLEVAQFLERFLGKDAFEEHEEEEGGEETPFTGHHSTRQLVRDLRKRFLFSGREKRRVRKVAALTELARTTPEEALEPVMDQLSSKDPMIVSAAITCLTEYTAPAKPKPLRDLAVNEAIDLLASEDDYTRKNAVKLLREIGPRRKDVKDKLIAFSRHQDSRRVKEALSQLLRGAHGPGPIALQKKVEASKGKEDEESPKGSTDEVAPSMPSTVVQLEERRAYMDARRAWIEGGKKGDPPPKPAGMD